MSTARADQIAEQVIGAAKAVQLIVGPGLTREAYLACLCRELDERRIGHRQGVDLTLRYKGLELKAAARADVVVEDEVVIRVQASESVTPTDESALLTQLKLSGKPVGVVINFNATPLRDGVVKLAV